MRFVSKEFCGQLALSYRALRGDRENTRALKLRLHSLSKLSGYERVRVRILRRSGPERWCRLVGFRDTRQLTLVAIQYRKSLVVLTAFDAERKMPDRWQFRSVTQSGSCFSLRMISICFVFVYVITPRVCFHRTIVRINGYRKTSSSFDRIWHAAKSP